MTQREIGIIVAKLEALHEDIRDLLGITGGLEKRTGKLEQKVNKLETNWSWFRGVSYAVAGVISTVGVWLFKSLKDM